MGIKGLQKNPIDLAIVGCGRVDWIPGRCVRNRTPGSRGAIPDWTSPTPPERTVTAIR